MSYKTRLQYSTIKPKLYTAQCLLINKTDKNEKQKIKKNTPGTMQNQ